MLDHSPCMCLVWICVTLVSIFTNTFVEGRRISAPDFQTGWMPIKNGLMHIARRDIPHGLNEVPILVDVSVKIGEQIFPASGFRPDHPVEMSGPVVYIYNDKFVNVSTSPNTDTLYQVIPTSTHFYSGFVRHWHGPILVRVRAWTRSSLPPPDFETSGVSVKARSGSALNSYAEKAHGLDTVPCLVVTRAKMSHPTDTVDVYADAVGSSMETYTNVAGMTNAYLVYGYSGSHIRIWVDASQNGAIFDGRKHTWFDFVIYDAEVEMLAWSCSSLTPWYNQAVRTDYTAGELPAWWNLETDYTLEHSLIRIMTEAVAETGANKGYRFPASMHLAYPADLTDGLSTAEYGGLSYSYTTSYKIDFWKPRVKSEIFVGSTFGNGRNTETSHSKTVHAISWMPEEDADCLTPVIYKAIIDGVQDVTTQNTTALVECMAGYHIVESQQSYLYSDLEPNIIKCVKWGNWGNVPTCEADAKELGEICNPAERITCKNALARCVLSGNLYRCQCAEGYKVKDLRCILKEAGTFLSEPDFDSGWESASLSSDAVNIMLEHKLGEVPIYVDARIRVGSYVFPMLGFRPDDTDYNSGATTVYIYDEHYINVTALQDRYDKRLVSMHNTRWTGWSTQWGPFGDIRVRAWKANSLPTPDFSSTSTTLRANSPDSFSDVVHHLGEYPGLIVVRAKMVHDGRIFYADGVGSALNVYYGEPGVTNAYLVYGFNDEHVRLWVDSSSDGFIFDGRNTTLFNFTASEAVVEIFAWKLSTVTPHFTYKFPLHDYDVPNDVKFGSTYELSEEINMVWVEIDESNSVHKGYRFPASTFLAMRFSKLNVANDDCAFGGFMYGLDSNRDYEAADHFTKYENRMMLYKPDPGKRLTHSKGSTVCVPNTFGNGQKTGSADNGVGILYSWVNPDCGTPVIEHARVTLVNGTYFGAVAMVTCDEGYHSYSTFMECEARDKAWSTVVCYIDRCNLLISIVNGSFAVNGSGKGNFGETVTFTCDDGFDLIGSEVLSCGDGGVWSDELPLCKCTLPNPPANGKITVYDDRKFGDNVTFTCDDGFDLVESGVLKCGHGGEPPSCKSRPTSASSVISASATFCIIQMMSILLLASE